MALSESGFGPCHLTLEQLSQKRGEPVWISLHDGSFQFDGWAIFYEVSSGGAFMQFNHGCNSLAVADYQKTWFAYDRKPDHTAPVRLHPAESGLTIHLPCPLGSQVFTIEEKRFSCDECVFVKEAKYQPCIRRTSCELENGRKCPLYIEPHTVEGFTVSHTNGLPHVSNPGAWDCDGLRTFSGIDGKWYHTLAEAETARKDLEKSNR